MADDTLTLAELRYSGTALYCAWCRGYSEGLQTYGPEVDRLLTAMRAAYDSLHEDNDADSAERILRVALQGSANALNGRNGRDQTGDRVTGQAAVK